MVWVPVSLLFQHSKTLIHKLCLSSFSYCRSDRLHIFTFIKCVYTPEISLNDHTMTLNVFQTVIFYVRLHEGDFSESLMIPDCTLTRLNSASRAVGACFGGSAAFVCVMSDDENRHQALSSGICLQHTLSSPTSRFTFRCPTSAWFEGGPSPTSDVINAGGPEAAKERKCALISPLITNEAPGGLSGA